MIKEHSILLRMAIIVLFAFSIFNLVFGFEINKANGISMYPEYSNGALTYNKLIKDNKTLEIGKVYVYRREDILIIHRLINIYDFNYGNNTTEKVYVFKGDHNAFPDYPVIKREDIHSKVIFGVNKEEC